MTRKDYTIIAKVLKLHYEQAHLKDSKLMVYSITLMLCYMFELDKPRFNRSKFLKLCGF